jgi:hypothetical protein
VEPRPELFADQLGIGHERTDERIVQGRAAHPWDRGRARRRPACRKAGAPEAGS